MTADGRSWTGVRLRITVLATLLVAGMLTAAAIGLVVTQRRLLTRSVDDTLAQRADDLAALVAADEVPGTLAQVGDDTLAQLVGRDGEVQAASQIIQHAGPIGPAPPAGEAQQLRSVDSLAGIDDPYRVLSRRVDSAEGPVTIHVARDIDDMDESIQALISSLLVLVPLLSALIAALTWWLVGRTLRPVEAIRAEVAEIGGDQLNRRVPEPSRHDEIGRLARTMNAMLDRVELATRRQQRFVADASHELRSPLTRMRSELEVDLAHPATADLAATHRSLLDETTGLQELVDDLLQLARSDSADGSVRRDPVDLDDIVLREARRVRAARDSLTVDTSQVSAAQVLGDRDQLTRALRNLVDNAARHASGTVQLLLRETDHQATLEVIDDGPGIPAAERERIFERFARLDDARTRAAGGAGLGLAITREIVEHHGGTVVVDPDHHPGTSFVVRLPLVPG